MPSAVILRRCPSFRKYYVAGVLDICYDIFCSMSSRKYPAVDRRISLTTNTGAAFTVSVKEITPSSRAANGCNGFKSRTRSLDRLGGINIVKRIGHITLQFCKVSCIHASGHTVVIITSDRTRAWISPVRTSVAKYSRQYRIQATGLGVSSRLIFYFNKIVGISTVSHSQPGSCLWIVL